MPQMTRRVLLSALIVCLCSCAERDAGNHKVTVPVSGEVYVDGEPAAGVMVVCHNVKGIDKENPTQSRADTDSDGVFQLSTYKAGDGVPEGEYVLTFTWQKIDVMKRRPAGTDNLNDRYKDPAKSEFKVSVEEGEPIDLGRIDLTTK